MYRAILFAFSDSQTSEERVYNYHLDTSRNYGVGSYVHLLRYRGNDTEIGYFSQRRIDEACQRNYAHRVPTFEGEDHILALPGM